MKDASWQALIADVKASRRLDRRSRADADRALRQSIARTVRRYPRAFRLAPEILRGDELQAVLRPEAPALEILTYLRAQFAVATRGRVELRAGIGHGPIPRLSPKGPFQSDGPAFHRARLAIQSARKTGGTRRTGWVVDDAFFDPIADVVLGLVDAFASRWTVAQWEAVVGRIEGKALRSIATSAKVSPQAVSKRLLAASWSEVERAIHALERIAQALGAPTGGNRTRGRSTNKG